MKALIVQGVSQWHDEYLLDFYGQTFIMEFSNVAA